MRLAGTSDIGSGAVPSGTALAFLAQLAPEELASLLAGVRPELVALALNAGDPDTVAATAQLLGLAAGDLPRPTRRARPEILTSLATGLQADRAAAALELVLLAPGTQLPEVRARAT